jgi:hypothetical protein
MSKRKKEREHFSKPKIKVNVTNIYVNYLR